MTHARTPKRMVTDSSVCEFPAEYLSGVYEYAVRILHRKIEGVASMDPILDGRCARELELCKSYLRKQDPSGTYRLEVADDGELLDRVDPGNHQWTENFFYIN